MTTTAALILGLMAVALLLVLVNNSVAILEDVRRLVRLELDAAAQAATDRARRDLENARELEALDALTRPPRRPDDRSTGR